MRKNTWLEIMITEDTKTVPWLSPIHKEGNKPCFIYMIKYGWTTFTVSVNVLNENTVRTVGIQITLYFIMSSISLVQYCCYYENRVCITSSQRKTETNIMQMWSDFKVWKRF